MNGNCHFVFAGAVGVSASLLFGLDETQTTLMIATSLIGGIFPDIDNPKSNMGQLSKPVSTIIGKIGNAIGKSGTHHRGIFHDPMLYAIGLIFTYLYFPPLIGFFIGAFSHLFLDMMNPSGIRLCGVKFLRLAKVPSGSKESVVLTWIFTFIVLGASIFYRGTFAENSAMILSTL